MPRLYEYRIRKVRSSRAAEHLGLTLQEPRQIAAFFRTRLHHHDREQFFVGHLDALATLVGYELTAIGGPLWVEVHPSQVFRGALLSGAAGIVLAHNHPSGDPKPSPDDDGLTRRLHACGQRLGTPVLDHLIVTDAGYYSYHEANRIVGR